VTAEARKPNSTIADLRFVIENAQLSELVFRPADNIPKCKRNGKPIGGQGLVLDAMDDERLTVDEARMLLKELNRRLFGGAPGMSRILSDGTIQPLTREA